VVLVLAGPKVYNENKGSDCGNRPNPLVVKAVDLRKRHMTRQGYAFPRRATPRKWVTAFALLAFFLQSLTLQTHIHLSQAPAAVKAQALQEPGPAPVKNQDPLDQCRLCQELAHAGTFFTPSAALLTVSLNFIAAIFVPLRDPADSSAKPFAWQSRAPPRH